MRPPLTPPVALKNSSDGEPPCSRCYTQILTLKGEWRKLDYGPAFRALDAQDPPGHLSLKCMPTPPAPQFNLQVFHLQPRQFRP